MQPGTPGNTQPPSQPPQYPPTTPSPLPPFQSPQNPATAPSYQPPHQPGPGKKTNVPLIIGIVAGVLLLVCVCCGIGSLALSGNKSSTDSTANTAQQQSNSSAPAGPTATPEPTATATPKPQPTSVLKVQGSGQKSTKTFHVTGEWMVKWSCTNNSSYDAPFAIFIYPKGESQMYYDSLGISCPTGGKHTDESTEHEGGDYYLKIISSVPYSIEVVDIPD